MVGEVGRVLKLTLLLGQLHVKVLLVGLQRLQAFLLRALLSFALDKLIELLHALDAENPVSPI